MDNTDDSAAIAAFIAARGVTRVAEGERALSDNRGDWRARVRGETTPDDLIEQRCLAAVDAAGREYWVNGLGERLS